MRKHLKMSLIGLMPSSRCDLIQHIFCISLGPKFLNPCKKDFGHGRQHCLHHKQIYVMLISDFGSLLGSTSFAERRLTLIHRLHLLPVWASHYNRKGKKPQQHGSRIPKYHTNSQSSNVPRPTKGSLWGIELLCTTSSLVVVWHISAIKIYRRLVSMQNNLGRMWI